MFFSNGRTTEGLHTHVNTHIRCGPAVGKGGGLMPEMNNEYERFFDREGFNKSLNDFEDEINLADILNALISEKEVTQEQLSPILYALLVDKYGYMTDSYNMESTLEDFEHIQEQTEQWKAVDIVLAYHHPELGFTVINPKNKAHWGLAQNMRKNELVSIYAGMFDQETDEKIASKAIETCIRFLQGKKTKSPQMLLKGDFTFKPFELEGGEEEEEQAERRAPASRPRSRREPVRATATGSSYESTETEEEEAVEGENESDHVQGADVSAEPDLSGGRRMTPMYSVPVTNELFHNGNVEAWKKIIQSYQAKYEGCQVLVFYEGERIHDINTLFKWGKVKHGSTILFAVVGEQIKDVAKLQRYLRQGASSMFEAFLRVPVNTVLNLF